MHSKVSSQPRWFICRLLLVFGLVGICHVAMPLRDRASLRQSRATGDGAVSQTNATYSTGRSQPSQRTVAPSVGGVDNDPDEQRRISMSSATDDAYQCVISGAVEYRGMPATGATVVARGGGLTFVGMANSQGEFLVGPVPQMRYTIEAYGYGGLAGATAPQDVECGADRIQLVIIDRGAVSGTIVDGLERPLAGATVHLTYQDEQGHESTTTRSDINGQFELQCLWPGQWVVFATSATRHLAGYTGPFRLHEAEWIENVTVRLLPAATVRIEFPASSSDVTPYSVRFRSAGNSLGVHPVDSTQPTTLCLPAGRNRVEVVSRLGSTALLQDLLLAPGDQVAVRVN